MSDSPEIQALCENGPPSSESIDEFIRRNSPFPIIRGAQATFVFRGNVSSVRWQHWIFGLTSSQEFKHVESTDFWHLTVDLRRTSRVEYKLHIEHDGQSELICDPLNPQHAFDPFGSNSICTTEGYERPDWTIEHPETRKGTLEEHTMPSGALGRTMRYRVYIPARFRKSRRYATLIVHDGSDYLHYSSLKTVLDNLIHNLDIPPLIVAISDSSDRLLEYAAHAPHAHHIVHELLPELERSFPLDARPRSRCLMGASFGAVATLHTAWRHPGVFGRLLLQSGSFAFSDIGHHRRGPLFDPVAEFVNQFRKEPGRSLGRVFVSCGIYESLIYENRSLVPILQSTGCALRFVEARDGHNWENWRDRLREGLSWIYPGPLWRVYP